MTSLFLKAWSMLGASRKAFPRWRELERQHRKLERIRVREVTLKAFREIKERGHAEVMKLEKSAEHAPFNWQIVRTWKTLQDVPREYLRMLERDARRLEEEKQDAAGRQRAMLPNLSARSQIDSHLYRLLADHLLAMLVPAISDDETISQFQATCEKGSLDLLPKERGESHGKTTNAANDEKANDETSDGEALSREKEAGP